MSHNSHSKNTYLSYTEGSYPKTDEFATNTQRTINKIGETNPWVQAKGIILQPFTNSVNSNYILYKYLWNKSMRATIKEKLYEKAIITILRQLDIDIQHVYKENTEEYLTIFIKNRSSIYEGLPTRTQLINLKALSLGLVDYPSLDLLRTPFDTSILAYNKVVMDSKDSKIDLDEQSKKMEKSRVKWCVKGYGVTGGLMEIYEDTPENVGDIFNISIFDTRHTHIDPDKSATVVPLSIGMLKVFNGVYDSFKTYQIHNCGFGNVQGGSLPASDTLKIPNPLTWLPDETKIVAGAQLGDIMNRFLGFKSEDLILPGEIRIKEITA